MGGENDDEERSLLTAVLQTADRACTSRVLVPAIHSPLNYCK